MLNCLTVFYYLSIQNSLLMKRIIHVDKNHFEIKLGSTFNSKCKPSHPVTINTIAGSAIETIN